MVDEFADVVGIALGVVAASMAIAPEEPVTAMIGWRADMARPALRPDLVGWRSTDCR